MRKIILASTSPRRQDLLKRTGLRFTIEASEYEEDMTLPLPARKLVNLLSLGKAEAVAKHHKDAIVISADTFVIVGGKFLGKARSRAEAAKILRFCGGKKQTIITGLTVIDTKRKKVLQEIGETHVYFKKISAERIASYLKTGEWIGKAGAYAIQGLAADMIKKIEGDQLSAIGLPMGKLVKMLTKLGVKVPKY